MKKTTGTKMTAEKAAPRRRDVLLALGAGAGAVAVPRLPAHAAEKNAHKDYKRRALYRADSPEIQTYYRVNRYPK